MQLHGSSNHPSASGHFKDNKLVLNVIKHDFNVTSLEEWLRSGRDEEVLGVVAVAVVYVADGDAGASLHRLLAARPARRVEPLLKAACI